VVFNGILKLMPCASRTVNKKHLTFNIKSIVNCQLSIVEGRSKGFTLIELLVVITLFAITSTLITASYLTFERNQRIRNAAQILKNDLRFAQNKALAGDKGVSNVSPSDCTNLSQCCPNRYLSNNYSLVGWYVTFDTAQTSTYTYAGVCKRENGTETFFPNPAKTVSFPSGVTLKTNGIKIGGTLRSGTVKVLFKHLATDVALHSSGPPFVSSNTISFSGDLTIELEGQQTSNVNTVTVRPTGEISGN